MSRQIIEIEPFFATPPGRYLLAWERAQLDLAVANIFGFHALQLGLPGLDALAANRMQHRWLATQTPAPGADFVTDFSALPFSAHSLDLVVLPHALEQTPDPHAALREVERVLVPEGRVVICGLNPLSHWALRQRRAQLYGKLGLGKPFLPDTSAYLGYWRLRDWLRLLGFEVELGQFGCYRPAIGNEKWLQGLACLDAIGARAWPVLGAVYFLVAVKRVRRMTLLTPGWNPVRSLASAPVSIATHATLTGPAAPFDTNKRTLD